MAARVCVVGDVAADCFVQLPAGYLTPGSEAAADEKVTAERVTWLPGGTGANAAVTAAVLGSAVSLHSAVGDDQQGRWLTDAVAARGVDATGIRAFRGTSTQAFILLSGASRRVIVDRGVADHLAELEAPRTTSADVVYVTGSGLAIRRLASAGLAGRIVAGIECGMADELGRGDVLGGAHLVITNAAGWQRFAGRLPGGVTVIETQGSRGVAIHYGSGRCDQVPAVAAETVDATGAGDCFAGALCHYLRAGLELGSATRLAVAAAALSTRALGAQSALPADAQVRSAARAAGLSPGPEN